MLENRADALIIFAVTRTHQLMVPKLIPGLAAVILYCLASCAIAEDAQQTLEVTMQAYNGHFREQCLSLDGGQVLSLSLVSPHPVRVNVHHHTDTETLFLLDLLAANIKSKPVTAPEPGEYCIEVRNVENVDAPYELRLAYSVSPH